MNNTISVKNKNIWWRWQVYDKYKWLGVAYNPTGCWLFDYEKFGEKGAKIWQEREKPGQLIILSGSSSGNHFRYTNAVNLFARKCKNKIKEKFSVRKYILNNHMRIKSSDTYKYYGLDYLLNKYNLNIDVIKFISQYLQFHHVLNLDKYLEN